MQPKCVGADYSYDDENNLHHYYKIFKVPRASSKGKKCSCAFEFEISDDTYIIKFEANKNTFIYDVDLVYGRKILDIRRRIPQNILEYKDKIDYFLEALKNEKDKIGDLYKDTLELYSKKKGFSFLIPFFLKIYHDDSSEKLCEQLLELFKSMNGKQKDNEKNMDRKAYLKDYIEDFKIICEEKIDNINYNTIDFYGLILCYLNFYDYENFLILFEKLFLQKKKDLYEILLIYNTHFKYPINQDLNFFLDFIEDIILNKDFKSFQIGINYIKTIEIYIEIIYQNKDKIFNKFIKDDINDLEKYNIKIGKNLVLKETPKNEKDFIIIMDDEQKSRKSRNEIPDYLKKIKKIIEYCEQKKIILIYFKNDFWKYILDCYKEPKQVNILICHTLRNIFIQYFQLIKDVIQDEQNIIKREAKSYMDIDRFAFLLDENIKKYIDKNNDIGDIEKLDYISKFNPYYNDPKYSNKVNSDIFNSFSLTNINKEFIEDFKKMKFEKKFKNKLDEYITKMISKIKNIFNFGEISKLINIEYIEPKTIILEPLNKKFDNIIKQDIDELSGKNSEKALKIVADFTIFNFRYETKDRKKDFISKKIKELPKNIVPKIFIEIVKIYFDEGNKNNKNSEDEDLNKTNKEEENIELKELIDYIFDDYVNNVVDETDINNILNLLDCFKEKNFQDKDGSNDNDNDLNQDEIQNKKNEVIINNFLEKLMEKNLFKKEDFFSGKSNIKITLLYKLYEKGKIKENDSKYYENIIALLKDIKNDLDGDIKKRKLDEFMKNDESFIIQRLSLIKLIFGDYNPDNQYEELKRRSKSIDEDLKNLRFIKDNIILYFQVNYKEIIKKLSDIIQDNQNKKLNDYNGEKINKIKMEVKNLERRANEIENIKDFLLFNIIYEMNSENNEEKKFEFALKELQSFGDLLKSKSGINELYYTKNEKYRKIVEKIQDKLIGNENDKDKAKEFMEKFEKRFQIKDSELIKDLTILFKSKKYELDIKGIIFFFDNFEKDNKEWNNQFSIKKSKKDFLSFKKDLEELQKKGIYNYINIPEYNTIFACLYDKKEAMEFLFEKIGKNINYLKDRIQPTITTLEINDIDDTQKCIKEITEMKKMKDNFERFEYIKNIIGKNKIISQFVNYSKIFASVIDLDRYYDKSENIYDQVEQKIKICLSLNILQDDEHFTYVNREENEDKKEDKICDISMEELVHLKNKITIKEENQEQKNNKINEDGTETIQKQIENENDKLKLKRNTLITFKKLIINLEIINEYMKDLRIKGSSLPIQINIKVKDLNKITYNLGDTLNNFEDIKNFLLNAKNNYNTLLDSIYKEKLNLRFLYGKQFRNFMKHLEIGAEYNIDSFLRYILNITDCNQKINEGFITINRNVEDHINHYKIYEKDSLENISNYITSLFINNDRNLDTHYDQIKMWKNYKGIYLYNSDNISMEKLIIDLFWDKLHQLPISQNVLITSKETSDEEIQAFFHRAILCNYNTLFVVEINDSFTEYQQTVMNNQIDQLLTYKNEKCNLENNKNYEKRNTENYLDSCIVFIYDVNNKNITSFLKEIKKFNEQKIDISKTINDMDTKIFDNIQVITSEICGLGKSGLIRKKIKEKGKIYFHFPLGGILTKNVIFKKLKNLLDKIKKHKYKYKEIAIHLDLTESKEKSILNEFFFSFLITKFYSNNENIIYIPNDISIYIEIPNCFENYLSKFTLLNIFNIEKITIEKMPSFNYPDDIIKKFDLMLQIKDNEKLEKFVKEHIYIKKYCYHQIDIFIKLFISNFYQFGAKLNFTLEGKNITETCINESTYSSQYFTNSGFAQLLTGTLKIDDKKDYIDKLSEVYKNDLKEDKYNAPLLFLSNKTKKLLKFFINNKEDKKYVKPKEYLKNMKDFLNLPNEVEQTVGNNKSLISIIEEKDNNYVITSDNFNKMILLYCRIKANIPVIIMGETGCGKTALIKKLNQLVNNGELTVEIINIHPGINDEKLSEIMKLKDIKAKEKKDEELWLFFDEINTCLSLSLITEIFINRTYNGNKISDNIRLIGACNPYRKISKNKEKCGLSLSEDNENELVYLVNPLPQSLLYYVFSFGPIDVEDEKKYIKSIIQISFLKDEEKQLHKIVTEAISTCHIYLRSSFDSSVVSLREIARFNICIKFFLDYFSKKNQFLSVGNNEKNNKIRSIICTIYLLYYIRLKKKKKRHNFEVQLRPILLKMINEEKVEEKKEKLLDEILDEDLKREIIHRDEKIDKNFSDFLKIEQDFLIDQIKDINKGIGKNTLLKENLFLLFVSVVTDIPLIIIGKPGSGKSLSAQIIKNSMKGAYSKNKFFTIYKKIIQTYFQGSESTLPEDVENLFEKAEHKLDYYKEHNIDLPISMPLFDELGLAEQSKSNPLKVLHSKLEYAGKADNVSFVGISNYTLDAAKINRALVLSVPDLDQKLDQLTETAKNIVESISPKIKNDIIFDILSRTYFSYKQYLKIIKELMVLKKYMKERSEKNKTIKNEENTIEKQKEKKEEINSLNLKMNLSNMKIDNNNNEKNENQNKEIQDNNQSVTNRSPESLSEQMNDKNTKGEDPEHGEKLNFDFIQHSKEFKDLMKKEHRIRIDFHGNRDFYYLIKGIANDIGDSGDFNDNEKVLKIIKHIERNFGGIEYVIDINFNLKLEGIQKKVETIKKILEDYEFYKENGVMRVNSVFLFKKLYNLNCDELDSNSNLKINELKINNYDLNSCINDNINDKNSSRFILLEVKQSLTTLICQKIKSQNEYYKTTKLYDGSPFIDDNNKAYRFDKIKEIMSDAGTDKLIIIENLNQIHAFLYDLYNMNYEIINDKKYARICLDNNNDQQTLVNDKFRIIILVDKNFVNNCNLAFLNRLEKMNLSFGKLLDNNLKTISKNIIEELNLKDSINEYNDEINYSLRDLLINCGKEEIEGLIYYFSKDSKKHGNDEENEEGNEENINEDEIKENVAEKIYKILPQDIIAILPKDNILKKKYFEKKDIYNFEEYKNFLFNEQNEQNKNYKISVLYTYTSIAGKVNGLNNEMSFMISEIKSEKSLKNLIEDYKNKYESNLLNKSNYICIHFKQSNSKHIKYICNFIFTNFENDNFKYIIILHINRNLNKNKKERIDSIPDINPKINQIFIDDLNGNREITLSELATKDIQTILNEKKTELKLNEEFKKVISNFVKKEFEEKEKVSEYIKEILKYMDKNDIIKDKIIETTYKLIEENKDNDEDCKDIIAQIYKNNYINKYTLDIVSCLIDFIKDNIFTKYLLNVLQILEDNNCLTTLLEIERKKSLYRESECKNSLDNEIVEKIITKILKSITINKYSKKSKFLYNYNVPGFYNFLSAMSDFINKNIISNYLNSEKKIRFLKKEDVDQIREFHEIEESCLKIVYNEFETNHKFIYDIMKEIPEISDDLIFGDYITYFLQKYKNKEDFYENNDIYHRIIESLIDLRFNKDSSIIKSCDKKKIIFMKMIWIESNVNYLLNIFKIIEAAKEIYNENEEILFNSIKEFEFKDDKTKHKIKYISNENKNPEFTKEVNGCYYILLASICYSVTEEIKLDLDKYYSNIKDLYDSLENLNEDLNIFLNEMYIIDELIKIIEIFNFRNIERINDIRKYLRESSFEIQKFANKNPIKLSEELIKKFEEIYKRINNDEDSEEIIQKNYLYYDNLRYILFKEIKKISDTNYHYKILEKLIDEKEVVKKSIDIFEIFFENCLKKEKFENNLSQISFSEDSIVKLIDKKLYDEYNALEETLLYLFEKFSLFYLDSIENNKINLEDQPLEIFNQCIAILDYYENNPEKLANYLKQLGKLFSLGYIKVFCYKFIKLFENNHKWINVQKIIKVLNGKYSICKMVRLYIYKILYNKYSIYFFYEQNNLEKYYLNLYKDFEDFKQLKDLSNISKIENKVKTLNEKYYDKSYKIIDKLKKEEFNKKLEREDYKLNDYGIDNFYILSFNYTLLNLSHLDTKKTENNKKFFDKICYNLFYSSDKIFYKAMELFYNPQKFIDIKKIYSIDSTNIIPLLYGYRYCLNILSEKKSRGIYYLIYCDNNITYLKENFFPGNDTKFIQVYSDIINHFKYKKNEGCYVCLCKKWYYHSIPSGFQENSDTNKLCPNCTKKIGLCKRENYFRIFKDKKEIDKMNDSKKTRDKMKQINYITLQEFKTKYIDPIQNVKGIYITDKNNFKNDKKIVRNLSQISYRLLNYILYVNLFFARIIKEKNIDNFMIKGRDMIWTKIIYECWHLLKNELLKENIDSIEEFMNYIFPYLFEILNKEKMIDKYENLIKFEDILEETIQKFIRKFKEEEDNKRKENLIDLNGKEKNSLINLLKERYSYMIYDSKVYPFYKYFSYTEYLNKQYIKEKLMLLDENQYPTLRMYLEHEEQNKDNNDTDESNKSNYTFDNLIIFNKALNILNQKYFNNISTDKAETTKLTDIELYNNNKELKELFDNFINFYNNLKLEDSEGNILTISNENPLRDFFINENNNYGKSYKKIYQEFINLQQNDKIENLLNLKNISLDRINIQQVNEKELITLNLPEKISFLDILYNSSYRKILDNQSISYKEYVINFDLIEEKFTNLLLKHKKLLKDGVTEFIYNNEKFDNNVNDFISTFNKLYNCKKLLNVDGLAIYKFCVENKNNNLFKKIIKDFIELIKYLNDKRKEKNAEIKEEIIIYKLLSNLTEILSKDFVKLFILNDGLTVDKITEIFYFYIKCSFESIKNEIRNYQESFKDKEGIKKYFNQENPIKKKDFLDAIRLFIALVLLPEEDKEKKIKTNSNNIINYISSPYFWNKDIYNNKDFKKNLNELKKANIKINQIIPLYESLEKDNDVEDEFLNRVKNLAKEKEKEKEAVINANENFLNEDNNNKQKDDDDDDDDGPLKKPNDDEDDDEDEGPLKKIEDDDD